MYVRVVTDKAAMVRITLYKDFTDFVISLQLLVRFFKVVVVFVDEVLLFGLQSIVPV